MNLPVRLIDSRLSQSIAEFSMANSSLLVEGLTAAGCRLRQKRLVEQLQVADAEAILICDRRHVYYFSGYWAASYHSPLILVNADGSSHLVLPDTGEEDHFVASSIVAISSRPAGNLGRRPICGRFAAVIEQNCENRSPGNRFAWACFAAEPADARPVCRSFCHCAARNKKTKSRSFVTPYALAKRLTPKLPKSCGPEFARSTCMPKCRPRP